MKNNTRLAIVFTLAAALMSGTAMAGTSASAGASGDRYEIIPAPNLKNKDGSTGDYTVWDGTGSADSQVTNDGGKIITLDQIHEFFPHFHPEFIPDFHPFTHVAMEVTPRVFRDVRDFNAGEALVEIIMEGDASAFPDRRVGPQLAWIPPEQVAARRYAGFDDAVDRSASPDASRLSDIVTAGGDPVDSPERNRRAVIAIVAALTDPAVTGNDRTLGDGNTFYDPTGRELGPNPRLMELLLSDLILGQIKDLGDPKGDEAIAELNRLEGLLEEAREIENPVDVKNIISQTLTKQMTDHGVNTEVLMKIPLIIHMIAEIPEGQYADIMKMSEAYGSKLDTIKKDDIEGTTELLNNFAYELTGSLKIDPEEYVEMKGLTSALVSMGGIPGVSSEEELAEYNTKLVLKDFFNEDFLNALKSRGIDPAMIALYPEVKHLFAEVGAANAPKVVELSTKFTADLSNTGIPAGEVLNKFLSEVIKTTIDVKEPEEAKEIEVLTGLVKTAVKNSIPITGGKDIPKTP